VAGECRLIFILGNHEEMLLDSFSDEIVRRGWLQYGGAETLASYGGDADDIPPEHLAFFRAAVSFFETEREIFVHANLEPGVPLESQKVEWLRWTHLTGYEEPYFAGKRVVCGHTPLKSGYPLAMPGWTCIDTHACNDGWLTCLDVATNDYCQANQSGQLRFGTLETLA